MKRWASIYLGPVDGSDMKGILRLLKEASNIEGPVMVHVLTHKGAGYLPAERHPARFHGTEPFDIETGLPSKPRVKANYTDIFSTVMRKLGDRDEKVGSNHSGYDGWYGTQTFS